MKTFILALDALDYVVVDGGDFPNLKQVEYGEIDLSGFKELFTPVIWASFITGEPPEEHGIASFVRWRSPVLNWLQDRLKVKNKKYGRILRKLGFKSRNVSKEDLKCKTIFDYASRPIAISVPSYNEWEDLHYLRRRMIEAVGNEAVTRQLINENRRVYEQKVEKIFQMIKCDWDLFLVHITLIDTVGHLRYDEDERILQLYAEMDSLAHRIQNHVSDEFWFLIVSDHGMSEGKHTANAFYSSSMKVGYSGVTIQHFFNEVVKTITGRDLEKEEEIAKRLTKLGYVD